jgi:hypothetical protein
MAALDTLFKDVAKQVVADLGSALNTTITYTRKVSPSYNTATGALSTTNTTYSSISVPIEFVRSEEGDDGEKREAKIYITPNLIGSNQPTLQDEVILSYSGSNRTAQITDIQTYRGGQTYLFVLRVRF